MGRMLGAMGSDERRKCLSRGSTEEGAKGLRNRKKEKLLLERFVDRAKPGVQCWGRLLSQGLGY